MQKQKVSVMFVCLGNICRSPTAHGVFQKKIKDKGLQESVLIESSGTSDWHIGSPPDPRTAQVAMKRGADLSLLRGRQFIAEDFIEYDYILAMDNENLKDILALQPLDDKYRQCHTGLFLDFASDAYTIEEVPDPYHGGKEGFEFVFDLVEDASEGLLLKIMSDLAK